MSTTPPGNDDVGDREMSMAELQNLLKLQIQAMTLMTTRSPEPSRTALTMKNVKVPECRYDMNPLEFRVFSKDVNDYKHLTELTDEQVVIQIRLNMDNSLKRVIDTNYPNWNQLSVTDAIEAVGSIVKKSSNPVVFQKEFHSLKQYDHENIKEFITRLRILAVDCDFICPHDQAQDLTEYHIIHQIRCGILDHRLQQELLQRHSTLATLNDIMKYCETYESAKSDSKKLSETPVVASASAEHEEMVTS